MCKSAAASYGATSHSCPKRFELPCIHSNNVRKRALYLQQLCFTIVKSSGVPHNTSEGKEDSIQ